MSKTDFRKHFAVTLFTAIALSTVSSKAQSESNGSSNKTRVARSTDGTQSAADLAMELEVVAQNGRALLKVEDLKTLLGLESRDPSATRAPQDVARVVSPFFLGLSESDIKRLEMRLKTLDNERSTLAQSLSKESQTKREAIRQRRREIQARRLGADGRTEAKLAKDLYESILEESHLDAQIKRGLENFDNAHLVSLFFMQLKSQRMVHAISIGPSQIWASQNSLNVAQK